MQRCRGAGVQRSRGAEVQRCSGAVVQWNKEGTEVDKGCRCFRFSSSGAEDKRIRRSEVR